MPEPMDPLAAPIDFRRIIREPDGREWMVREIPHGYDRRSGTALIFERPDVIRKVRTFPVGWRSMSDDDLVALSLTI